ncbi:MAG: hypothetical protein JW999_08490 [Methanotrichaceae archaeon]|nr:hypothetical protein [Methanotrichaceae archaeon]
MKLILTVFVITVLLASTAVTASAADVLDLSTLGKKPSIEAVSLPQLSPTMPTIAPTSLGGNLNSNVLDLSTLGNKAQLNTTATMIKGASPVTITPMFAVKNADVTNQAGSVFTLPQAISASTTVYTPPIAIFGGA